MFDIGTIAILAGTSYGVIAVLIETTKGILREARKEAGM